MPPKIKSKPKMPWIPAPPALVRRFEETLRHFPEAQIRKMFGYPAAFVNGNMLGGVFQDRVMLRLDASDRASAAQAGATPFEPMPGRVMREYIVVPKSIMTSAAELRTWVSKALAYTAALPAKAAKPRRTKS